MDLWHNQWPLAESGENGGNGTIFQTQMTFPSSEGPQGMICFPSPLLVLLFLFLEKEEEQQGIMQQKPLTIKLLQMFA